MNDKILAAEQQTKSGERVGKRTRDGQVVQRFALPMIWILTIIVFGIWEPSVFLTGANFINIFGYQGITLVLTLGLLFPLLTGDFDLSIAANMGFCSMIIAVLNVNLGLNIVICLLIALCIGIAIGLLNAFVVVRLGISSFIVTLGTGTVLNGLALAVSGGATIGGIAFSFTNLVNDQWLGLPLAFYFTMLVAIVCWFILDMTPIGRRFLFIGSGSEVARLSGVRVSALRWIALTISGALSALSAVINVGVIGSADPTSSSLYLLPAFAACFLGATTIAPGRFNVWGTVITTYFLATGFSGLQIVGLDHWIQQVFYGGALVLAVVVAEVFGKKKTV